MAVIIPATAIEQNEKTQTLGNQDTVGYSRTWKDKSFSTLKTAADGIRKGDVYDTNFVVSSYELSRVRGGGGQLTIHFVPTDATSGSGSEATTIPKKEVWAIKAVRNDVSIMAYCGPSPGNNPNRTDIELWERETDAHLLAQDQISLPGGGVGTLTDPDLKLIAKKKKGVESVIRFYPMLTRRRTYSSFPDGCLDNLSYIDSPPVPTPSSQNADNSSSSQQSSRNVKAPKGLAGKVALYQWIKVDDSCDEDASGDWTRTESWIGIKKTDDPNQTPWDADLYGPNRWSMPYCLS